MVRAAHLLGGYHGEGPTYWGVTMVRAAHLLGGYHGEGCPLTGGLPW